MKLNYIGPLCVGPEHPAVSHLMESAAKLPPSCYLVEVSAEAGVDGPVIEGDVLVVDEARPVQHADLVVVQAGHALRLCRSHRIGGQFRLLPTAGPRDGFFARQQDCRGVVVRKVRMAMA